MARYQVIIAYDGTEFFGMQRQVEERTVQGTLEEALRVIGWQGKSILVAGRTDAGVHASGQVVAFDLQWRHSEQDLMKAINANLPADVVVKNVSEARSDFQPRFDALSRRYRYRVYCQPQRDPLQDRRAWQVWPALHLERIQTAAQKLVGEHDFAAFGTPPEEAGPTVRKVIDAGWNQHGERFSFEIEANAFLYHMVRRIVYFLVQVSREDDEIGRLEALLGGQMSEMVQGLAPARGLELIAVRYADSER